MKQKFYFFILIIVAFVTCKEEESAPKGFVEIKNIVFNDALYNEITCEVKANGTIESIFFEYSLDPDFKEFEHTEGTFLQDKYVGIVAPLQENSTYHIRCRVQNKYSSCVSNLQSFKTKPFTTPKVRTDSASKITLHSATLYGTLEHRGMNVSPEVGFCYAKHKEVTIKDSRIIGSIDRDGHYHIDLTELEKNVFYYVRAYATNSLGTSYGEELIFETCEKPTVTTSEVTDISYETATCGGNVTDDGGKSVTERGICYSTSKNPTISHNKVASGSSGLGTFTCNLTELSDGTIYYIRAYATNSKGTSYGDELTFTTKKYGVPTVTTSEVIDITYTTATCGGNVTDDGGYDIIERGICYSTSKNPTISSKKVTSGTGTGSFSCNLTDLAEGTTYYVCAYATNSKGTSYGEEKYFVTTINPNSVIYYTASKKLQEVTSSYASGLHVNSFGSASVLSHEFTNGNGIIVFNKELMTIGAFAFYDCSNLTSITIPNRVTNIGQQAFDRCSSLTSVEIGNSVTSIEKDAFCDCSSLTSVSIPNSVTSIGNSAFYNCSSLTSITIPNKVTSIGISAFGGCSHLTSVMIQNGVTSIGASAFSGCSSLTSIDIPDAVTSIGAYAFSNCSSLESVKISNNVKGIEEYTFSYCSELTSVSIGNSVTKIEQYAFYACSSLVSVSIPNNVNRIGWRAFYDCRGLTTILIGNGISIIDQEAFYNCNGLTSIRSNATYPPSCSSYTFYGVSTTIPVYVPATSVSLYKTSAIWNQFTNIQPISE